LLGPMKVKESPWITPSNHGDVSMIRSSARMGKKTAPSPAPQRGPSGNVRLRRAAVSMAEVSLGFSS
jgi:hypothetical protein